MLSHHSVESGFHERGNHFLSLIDAELDRVTAGNVRIGSFNAGTVTLTDAIDAANIAALGLLTGGSIQNALPPSAAGIVVASLALYADGGIGTPASGFTPADPIATTTGTLHAYAGFGYVVVSNTGSLTIAGPAGLSASGVDITTTGDLTVNEGIGASSYPITLTARGGTLTVNHNPFGLNGISGPTVNLFGAEIDLNSGAGSIQSYNGTSAIGPDTANGDVLLGGATNTPGFTSLTDTDMAALALSSVFVGRPVNGIRSITTAGPITLTGDVRMFGLTVTISHDVTVTGSASAAGNLQIDGGQTPSYGPVAVTADGDIIASGLTLSGGGTTTLTSRHGGVLLNDDINGTTAGAESLTVTAADPTAGVVTFLNSLGTSQHVVPLKDLKVTVGAAIRLDSPSNPSYVITAGDQTYIGPLALDGSTDTIFQSTAGGDVTFDGPISVANQFSNVTVTTDGSVRFAGLGTTGSAPYGLHATVGGATFTGDVLLGGVLDLDTTGPIAQLPGTTLTVVDSDVYGPGRLQLTAASLGTAAAPQTFAGTVLTTATTGDQYLRSVGATNVNTSDAGGGRATLLGGTFLTGPAAFNAGTVTVGTIASPLTVGNGATLGGTGTLGDVTVEDGGTLSPGRSPGVLTVGTATFAAGGTFHVQIDGTAAGTDYDQLAVTGTVNLGGATLAIDGSLAPAAGTTFVIVRNDGTDPVGGTFAGLPEGAVVDINGVLGRIDYNAGDGNDVVLIAGPTGTSTALVASANPALAGGPVTFTATVTGGIAGTPVVFTLDGSSMPFATAPLDAAGRAVATTTVIPPGDYTVTAAYAGDATTLAGSAAVPLTVWQGPTFSGDPFPTTAPVGVAFAFTAAASGFPTPWFALATGQLPPGLALDPATGIITGTPSAVGQYAGVIRATNAAGSADLAFSLAVTQTPEITGGPFPTTATALRPFSFAVTASGYPAPTFTVASGELPAGLVLDPVTGAITGTPTAAGRYGGVIRATNATGSADRPFAVVVTTTATTTQNRVSEFAVSGGSTATLVRPDGSSVAVTPFGPDASTRAVVADLTGDGVPDFVVGSGPGVAGQVVVIDGATGETRTPLYPFEATFTGGTFVAAGDVNGDGYADLAVSADVGGGPRVIVYDGKTGGVLADLLGIDDALFRGGARVAVGDVNGDGLADLVVAAGAGGGPRVAVFSGASLRPGATPTRLVPDFFAFEPTLREGTFVAIGDVSGDGVGDVVAGGGPTGAPRVAVFDGAAMLAGAGPVLVANFFAGDPDLREGARVAVKDLDGDANADLVVAVPTPVGDTIAAYRGPDLATGLTTPFHNYDAVNDPEVFVG